MTLTGERMQAEHLLVPLVGRVALLNCARSHRTSAACPDMSVSFPALSCILSETPSVDMAEVMHLMQMGDPASGNWSQPLQLTTRFPDLSMHAVPGAGPSVFFELFFGCLISFMLPTTNGGGFNGPPLHVVFTPRQTFISR